MNAVKYNTDQMRVERISPDATDERNELERRVSEMMLDVSENLGKTSEASSPKSLKSDRVRSKSEEEEKVEEVIIMPSRHASLRQINLCTQGTSIGCSESKSGEDKTEESEKYFINKKRLDFATLRYSNMNSDSDSDESLF